jgi:hypothetical protein
VAAALAVVIMVVWVAAAFGGTVGCGSSRVGRQQTAAEALAHGGIEVAAVGRPTAAAGRTVTGTQHRGHVEEYFSWCEEVCEILSPFVSCFSFDLLKERDYERRLLIERECMEPAFPQEFQARG